MKIEEETKKVQSSSMKVGFMKFVLLNDDHETIARLNTKISHTIKTTRLHTARFEIQNTVKPKSKALSTLFSALLTSPSMNLQLILPSNLSYDQTIISALQLSKIKQIEVYSRETVEIEEKSKSYEEFPRIRECQHEQLVCLKKTMGRGEDSEALFKALLKSVNLHMLNIAWPHKYQDIYLNLPDIFSKQKQLKILSLDFGRNKVKD